MCVGVSTVCDWLYVGCVLTNMNCMVFFFFHSDVSQGCLNKIGTLGFKNQNVWKGIPSSVFVNRETVRLSSILDFVRFLWETVWRLVTVFCDGY